MKPTASLPSFIYYFILFAVSTAMLSQCRTEKVRDEKSDDYSEKLSDVSVLYREIPNQYVVILKQNAVIVDGKVKHRNRERQSQMNENVRTAKHAAIDEIIQRHQLSVDPTHKLTDLLVGFKVRLTPSQYRALSSETSIDIYSDFEIRLRNPIQQSEPVPNRNPIQQDDADLWDFADTTRRITCAVNMAGGPADATSSESVVWVLDTGVDGGHDDLNVEDNPLLAVSFVPGETADGNGHGTHVAGIIGAYENELGATGVSAGARIIPVKVIRNSGSGMWSYLLLGLDHVARYNSKNDVVNLSLGAYDPRLCRSNQSPEFQVLSDAIRRLASDTTYIVIASGNESGRADHSLPGCIDDDNDDSNNIFVVAAIDCNSVCATYSNYGKPPVYWLANGHNVFSTYPGNQYALMSGTSMATAVVSGIIHANAGSPVSGGTISCGTPSRSYQVAKRR